MIDDIFSPADLLLYRGEDPSAFAVVACDQYTSEPDYWRRVEQRVGESPSALRLIFPEACLKTADFDDTVAAINRTMGCYLHQGLFRECPDSLLYVERRLRGGRVRRGLVGKLDLECYDFSAGSQSPVRATEGTVLERIPPRVKVRENAPLELPHVMVLFDDPDRAVIEPLAAKRGGFESAYAFDLMEDSGRLEGWLLPKEERERIACALRRFGDRAAFEGRYGIADPAKGVLQFAVGDGNHSLATAKQCYLELKARIGRDAALRHPARWALVELVNLHDESLAFEAIHRIVTGVCREELLAAFEGRFRLSDTDGPGCQRVDVVIDGRQTARYIANPSRNLPVGSLQAFLDEYAAAHPGTEIDYIHGADVVRELSAGPDSVGFLLPPMAKEELFRTVILDGALPRKTFSMGEACDKRFYFEARRIR